MAFQFNPMSFSYCQIAPLEFCGKSKFHYPHGKVSELKQEALRRSEKQGKCEDIIWLNI